MVRKAKFGGGRSTVQLNTTEGDLKQVPQTSEARKFKNVNAIQGITPLYLEKSMDASSTMEKNTPRSRSWADQTEEEVSELVMLEEYTHAKTPKAGGVE